jgi:hypothetical protein
MPKSIWLDGLPAVKTWKWNNWLEAVLVVVWVIALGTLLSFTMDNASDLRTLATNFGLYQFVPLLIIGLVIETRRLWWRRKKPEMAAQAMSNTR